MGFNHLSPVHRSSQGFTTVLKCSVEMMPRKKEISKLEGVFIYGYENPNFPTTSKNEFEKPTVNLKRLPFHHPRCAYISGSFLNTHVLKPFGLSAGFGFSEAVGLQTYVEGNGVR